MRESRWFFVSDKVSLRPMHIACVSGGKDSLFMLNYIFNHLDVYPLDLVVHFKLEIDYPFVDDVLKLISLLCQQHNVPFQLVYPDHNYDWYYYRYNLPTRTVRWCSNRYKASCRFKLKRFARSLNCKPIYYIGFCSDESSRFKSQLFDQDATEVYPLAEAGFSEDYVLSLYRDLPAFNGWYKIFSRQGCMFCPLASFLEFAYLYKFYPLLFQHWFDRVHLYETKFGSYFPYYSSCDDWFNVLVSKYLPRLENLLSGADKDGQFSFDFCEV